MKLLDLAIATVLLLALVAGSVTLHDHVRKQGYAIGFQDGVVTKTISAEHRRITDLEKRVKELETQVQVLAAEIAEHRCRVGKLEQTPTPLAGNRP